MNIENLKEIKFIEIGSVDCSMNNDESMMESINRSPAKPSLTTSRMVNVSTPIRPLPMMASSFSFDSGYEWSPISNFSFQFGCSEVSNLKNNLVEDAAVEDYEGIDNELVSIDQRHFTPIDSDKRIIESSSNLMQTEPAFNLAMQRRENQSMQINKELNNNDFNFPNAYNDAAQIDDSIEDDVFLDDDDDENAAKLQHWITTEQFNKQQFIGQSSHSQIIEAPNDEQMINSKPDEIMTSPVSGSSRCSSEPIDIPNGANISRVREDCLEDTNNNDSIDANESKFEQEMMFSVPYGRRMPYYHPMAPRLDQLNDSDAHRPLNHYRFGSHFQVSLSMIHQNRNDRIDCNCSTMSKYVKTSLDRKSPLNYSKVDSQVYESLNQRSLLTTLPEADNENVDEVENDDDADDDTDLQFPMSLADDEDDNRSLMNGMESITEQNESESMNETQFAENASMDIDLLPLMDRCINSCNKCIDFNRTLVINEQPLPDVVLLPKSSLLNRFGHIKSHNQRNTLLSCHEVPYVENDFAKHLNTTNERRTMSISLPIDPDLISNIGQNLRQISNEFQSFQIQRSNNFFVHMMTQNYQMATDGSLNNSNINQQAHRTHSKFKTNDNNIIFEMIYKIFNYFIDNKSTDEIDSTTTMTISGHRSLSRRFTVNNSTFYTGSAPSTEESSTDKSSASKNHKNQDEIN